MKKAILLLLVVTGLTTAFAQSRRNEGRDVILGQQNKTVYDRGNRSYDRYISAREKDEMIRRINREYTWRIESVRRDRYLRKVEKKRQIRALEFERDAELRDLNRRYHHQQNRSYGRY